MCMYVCVCVCVCVRARARARVYIYILFSPSALTASVTDGERVASKAEVGRVKPKLGESSVITVA